jgi:molybdopterin/thiamine biosynthesis adenylyltransferase
MASALHAHLFPGDGGKHGAVIGASVVETSRGTRLLGRRMYLAPDGIDYVPGQRGYRMLTPAFVRDRVLDCRREHLAYLAVHCHGGRDRVSFSGDDLASHERGYPALRDILGDGLVGGLVFAREAVAGDLWLSGGGRVELNSAVITGWPTRVLRPAPLAAATGGDPQYDRQSRLFGDRGQAILAGQKVGIIGAGGAGSLINEYLARLGVGHLVVIDPDRIESTNIPRVAGSRRRDAHPWLTDGRRPLLLQALGRRLASPKVAIARRVARQANPSIIFDGAGDDVVRQDIATRLIDCDFLFLAADTMQARLVFNALIHQYLIPGIQVGAKVQLDHGRVADVFSVVRPIGPGEGCLWCNQLISPAKLQDEALTPELRRLQRYVDDPEVYAPSVITLNAVAAAHAVNHYLMTITGLLDAQHELRWTRFHSIAARTKTQVKYEIPRRDSACTECGGNGRLGVGNAQRLPTRQ